MHRQLMNLHNLEKDSLNLDQKILKSPKPLGGTLLHLVLYSVLDL